VIDENTEKQFLRLSEFAKVLGIKYNTAWKLAKNKDIPAVQVGRTWYVPKKYLEQLLKGD